MALGPIDVLAIRPYLPERFAVDHSQTTQEGIAALLAITGGHTNDTRELAHFAWMRAVAEEVPSACHHPSRAERCRARPERRNVHRPSAGGAAPIGARSPGLTMSGAHDTALGTCRVTEEFAAHGPVTGLCRNWDICCLLIPEPEAPAWSRRRQ